jgi:hypothetical protein
MTRRSVSFLGFAVVLLLIILLLSERSAEKAVRRTSQIILSGVDSQAIAGLVLKKGEDEVELKLKDGVWQVPARSNYPADSGKLRSFLLKLLDLSSTQHVSAKDFQHFGVTDESPVARVTLKGSDDQELAAVLLGNLRKKGRATGMSQGQFVRRAGTDDVYLLGESVEVYAKAPYWLSGEVINLPQSRVKKVTQDKILTEGSGTERIFTIRGVREGEAPVKFEIDLTPAAKEQIQEPTVNSVAGGLENVRLVDVFRLDSLPDYLKDKPFDQQTVFHLTTGAVFTVRSLEHEGRYFAAFSVMLDEAAVRETTEETDRLNAKRKADYEQKKAEAEAARKEEEKADPDIKEYKTKLPPAFEPVKPDVLTAADVEKLNARLSPWLFEFQSYQGEKYRRGRADLVKPKAAQ